MTLDPYEILGVPRDATTAAIRKAYRRLSKTAHPDVGGDRAAFDLLTLAHDALTDDAMRAEYDRTGILGQRPVDNSHVALYESLGEVLDQVLGQRTQAGMKPSHVVHLDLVNEMRQFLEGRRDHFDGVLDTLAQRRAAMVKIVNRFHTKSGRPNVMAEIVAGKIREMDHAGEKVRALRVQAGELLTFLLDYGFDVEAEAPHRIVAARLGPMPITTANTW